MKTLKLLSAFVVLTALILACQKEVSFENGGGGTPSDGSLQGAGGNCLGSAVNGTYKKDTTLNSTNNVDVKIDVVTAGSYLVYTDTVNGMWFRATGNFTTAGVNTVRLTGFGKPIAPGTNTFNVYYDSTQCSFSVTTISGATGGTSAFTFTCGTGAVDSVAIGSPVTATDTVHMDVNVTTIGTWNITSTSANGVTYSGTGTFTTTGAQFIVLNASGTPTGSATTTSNLSVTYGTSTCSFPVTFVFTAPPNGDIFPLTANSWWSYDDPDGVFVFGDSMTVVNVGTTTFGGNPYRIFERQDETTPFDSTYYRKDASNNYYEWTWADYYTGFVAFNTDVFGAILFAKENMTTGQTWTSSEFSGTESSTGQPMKIQYYDTCYAANVSATVNGKSFTGVYKIKWRPKFNLANTGYQDEFVSFESWYAKGVGLIHFEIFDLTAGGTSAAAPIEIRNWHVF